MQDLKPILQKLDSLGIRYCIVGGLAAIAYGRPRLTLDADIVLALLPGDIKRLQEAFPLTDFYLPPEEVLIAESQRTSRGHFNILHQHSALRLDCYLPGKSELARWELAHRRQLETAFGTAWIAPPESVIAHKLLFFREGGSEKHLEDIHAMIDAGAVEDQECLLDWIRKLGLQPEWETVLQRSG